MEEKFDELVNEALENIPEEFATLLENVAVVVEDDPSPDQMKQLHLRPWTKLLGLYEGISIAGRANVYTSALPDKITIFKNPLLSVSSTEEELKENVTSTVIHEIAHHFGMSEQEVRKLERKRKL